MDRRIITFETDRLYLRVLNRDYARYTLDFYNRNKEMILRWEPDYMPVFYTLDYQKYLLDSAVERYSDREALCLWMYEKEAEDQKNPIGYISYQNIRRLVYQSCTVGYKLEPESRGRGYMREAMSCSLDYILREWELQKAEAMVSPENGPSIRLLEHTGFEREGISRSYMYKGDRWVDMYRYSYIRPDYMPGLQPENF